MPSAYTGAAVTSAAANIPDNISRRQEARVRQDLAQEKLQAFKAAAPVRESQQNLEMQQLKNDLRTAQGDGLKTITFNAFRRYEGDKDTKHLNTFLQDAKKNPIGMNMYSGVVRYDPVENTQEGIGMLKRSGIEDTDGYFADPSTVGNMVVATQNDGKRVLMDLDKVYAMTGYTQYMEDADLERMNKRSLIASRMRTGESRQRLTAKERMAALIAEEEGIPIWQAYERLGKRQQGTTALERLADTIQTENPDLEPLEAMQQAIEMRQSGSGIEREARKIADAEGRDYNEVFEELKTRKERTTSQKSVDELNVTKDELDKEFGGSFLDADLSKPADRRKAGRLIQRIEKDFPMSTQDRKIATEIRQLTSLANVAGAEITDEQTGPLDTMFRSVEKYISNNVEGIAGTSSYETFRNTMRHAMYGATLTKGETDAFNAAAGTLKEQTGPVMAKLRTQVADMQSKLTSIYDLNDEYVAKYRLNMSLDDLADVISALDERLELIDEIKAPEPAKLLGPGSKGVKKPVGDYFKRPAK